MITVELKVTGENEHQVIQVYADSLADLEWRGFNKSGRMVNNKVNGNIVISQDFRKGGSYAGIHKDSGQCLRNDAEPKEVQNAL